MIEFLRARAVVFVGRQWQRRSCWPHAVMPPAAPRPLLLLAAPATSGLPASTPTAVGSSRGRGVKSLAIIGR
jgi:hypothetical protein